MRLFWFVNKFGEILNRRAAVRQPSKRSMACSRFEYVKTFEQDDSILPNVWIVVRIDGKKFHKFSKTHNFEKPNDENGKREVLQIATN